MDEGVSSITSPVIGDTLLEIGNEVDLLGDNNETDNSAGDQDITLDIDGEILGLDVPDIEQEIEIDFVEAATGDIDLDVDLNLDALNGDLDDEIADALNVISNNSNDESSGTNDNDIEDWTETLSQTGEGLVSDITNMTEGDGGGILPNPTGSVGEGLGVLDVDPNLDLGGFGGLLG